MRETNPQAPSWKRIAGFAFHQGFMFSAFYTGANRGLAIGGGQFERADLFAVLAFLCLAFALLRFVPRARQTPRRPGVWTAALAVVLAAGSLMPCTPLSAHPIGIALEGALVGVPLAVLLAAWGDVLGGTSPRTAACEVFSATGFASALCFACAALPASAACIVPPLCALAGAAVLIACQRERTSEAIAADTRRADESENSPQPSRADSGIRRMTARMLAGSATFGVAAGFMEAYRSDPGMLSTPDFPATLLILALFCIAVLQALFVEKPAEGESLGSMYRIAMLVIMAGFLFAPLLEESGVPGDAIVLAGYLGLVAAFMAFFLAMGMVSKANTALALAGGMTAIYAGELAGIAAANVYGLLGAASSPYAIMACAGLAILFAYLFLFTERDFRALSAIVDTSNALARACDLLRRRYGLSPREAEVLELALRGRSNERIAQELFVAKSTADTHLRRIYGKTGAKSRQELIDLGERAAAELRAPKRG